MCRVRMRITRRPALCLKATVFVLLNGLLSAQRVESPAYPRNACDAGVVFDRPITITGGGTYTGNWQSTDPSVPAVIVLTTEPVTITHSRIVGSGDLLRSFSNLCPRPFDSLSSSAAHTAVLIGVSRIFSIPF